MLLQSTTFTSPFHSPITSTTTTKHYLKSLNPSTHFLGTALFPSLGRGLNLGTNRSKSSVVTRVHASFLEAPVLWAGRMFIFYALVQFGLAGSPPENPLASALFASLGRGLNLGTNRSKSSVVTRVHASFLEAPVLWAGRMFIFYALVQFGLAGSPPENPLASESETGVDDLGFSKWIEQIQGKPDKEAVDNKKLARKWHPTTKGTLKRNCRVASISEGRRLLKSIASLLSDDDQFRDATSHKGCQIRRESAHGESVCCNNVRALFDELPTPHLLVEITPFPAGPLTENDYAKAEKLERLLRPGPSV